MSTLDTQKTQGVALQEAKTPQAADGQTRTVSLEVPMENAYLDKNLSKRPMFFSYYYYSLGAV